MLRPEWGVVALTPIPFDPTTCEHLEVCRAHPEHDEHVPVCKGCIKDENPDLKIGSKMEEN